MPRPVGGPASAVIKGRAGGAVNARVGPSTVYHRAARLPDGTRVTVMCRVEGEMIAGPVRRTAVWVRAIQGWYVSDSYLRWEPPRPALPECSPGLPRRGPVVRAGGGTLNVRAGASTRYRRIGAVRDGALLTVRCQVYGEQIRGTMRRTAVWNRLASGGYVADAYLWWRPTRPDDLPWCGQGPPRPPGTHAEFIAWVAEPARKSMRAYRVPASVTIGQSILESGWGRSELSRMDHNYFGIKCFGDPGGLAVGCRTYPTRECMRGRCFDTTASFRVYRDPADSFVDHGRFLATRPRYRRAFDYTREPDRFAQEIHKAGYATDPAYSGKLIRLMRDRDLYRYDRTDP